MRHKILGSDRNVRDEDKDIDEDVLGRQITNFDETSEGEDVQSEDQDGNEDVQGRPNLKKLRHGRPERQIGDVGSMNQNLNL